MKLTKKIAALLALILLFTALPCAFAAEDDDPINPLDGGWYMPDFIVYQELPEAAQTAFSRATEQLVGVDYEPMLLLGTQVVAGMNYSILCRATVPGPEPAASLAVLTVYAALDGTAEVRCIAPFDMTVYAEEGEFPDFTETAGGWAPYTEYEGVTLLDEVEEAFNKASEGFAGVGYVPVFYIGSRVTEGFDYALLCKATTVTAEPETFLTVAVVHVDTEGNASFASFHPVNAADFNA